MKEEKEEQLERQDRALEGQQGGKGRMQSPMQSRDQDDIVGHNQRQLTPIEACYPSEKWGKVHHVNKEKQAKYLTRRTAIQEGKEQKDKEEDLQVGVQRHRGKT